MKRHQPSAAMDGKVKCRDIRIAGEDFRIRAHQVVVKVRKQARSAGSATNGEDGFTSRSLNMA